MKVPRRIANTDLANADLKLEGLTAIIRGVKLLAISERAPIVHRQHVSLLETYGKKREVIGPCQASRIRGV